MLFVWPLKKEQSLTFPLFPATQLRLTALPFLFESLISISSHARNFFFLVHSIFLACCKSRAYEERNTNSTRIKEEYISMDIFPGLKIHYLLQIVETGIHMHCRHMIWGRICYSMVMAMVLKKKKIRWIHRWVQKHSKFNTAFLSSWKASASHLAHSNN